METTAQTSVAPTSARSTDEPSCFVINLYTSLTDRQSAIDLAIRVAGALDGCPEIDELATTVSEEDHPDLEPARVFIDFPQNPGSDKTEAFANAMRYLEESG